MQVQHIRNPGCGRVIDLVERFESTAVMPNHVVGQPEWRLYVMLQALVDNHRIDPNVLLTTLAVNGSLLLTGPLICPPDQGP